MNTRDIRADNPLIERIQRHATMAVLFRSSVNRDRANRQNPTPILATASFATGTEASDSAPADLLSREATEMAQLTPEPTSVQTSAPAPERAQQLPVLPERADATAREQRASAPLAQGLPPQGATPSGTDPAAGAPAESASAVPRELTPGMQSAPNVPSVLRAVAYPIGTGPTQIETRNQNEPSAHPPRQTAVGGPAKRDADVSSAADPVWQRLQTIYRKHQEVAAGGETSTDEQSSGVPSAVEAPGKPDIRQPRAGTTDQVKQAGAAGSLPVESPAAFQAPESGGSRERGELDLPAPLPPPPAHSSLPPAASDTGRQPQVRETPPPANVMMSARQEGSDAMPPRPQSAVQGKESEPKSSTVQRYVDDGSQALTGARPNQASTIPAGDDRSAAPDVPAQDDPAEQGHQTTGPVSEHELPLQSVPLEAVWPVQRRGVDSPPAAVEVPSRGATTTPQPLSRADDPAMQSILQALPTARPTQSEIEVLAPRRPRPQVQRRQENLAGDSPTPNPTAPRTSPIPGTPAATPGEPFPVETEIGLLPGDLWELIGQTPPSHAGESSTAGHASSPAADIDDGHAPPQEWNTDAGRGELSSTAIQRKSSTSDAQEGRQTVPADSEADSEGFTQADTPVPRTASGATGSAQRTVRPGEQYTSNRMIPEDIERATQRTAERTGRTEVQKGTLVTWEAHEPPAVAQRAATNEGGPAQPQPASDEAPDPERSVDVNKLAADVYAVLRRRLSVEWERLRDR